MSRSKFLTENIQLSSIGVCGFGDNGTQQVLNLVRACYSQGTTEQLGVMAMAKVNTDVYADAVAISKMLPKEMRNRVIGACLKSTIALRELEKSEKFAEEKRGIWLPKLKQLVEVVVDKMQAHQVEDVVLYHSSGGNAVISREFALMLMEKYKGLHFVNVLSRPQNDLLAEPIHENNKEFCIRHGLLSIEIESELSGNSFAPRDFINNLSLLALLNENKTGVSRSAPDTLRLAEIGMHHQLKIQVVANAQYQKQEWVGKKIYNHRDITTDSIQRGIENIGVCQKCIYSIVGHATEEQVRTAIKYIGKGKEDFALNYRLLPTTRNMESLLIGKLEPC